MDRFKNIDSIEKNNISYFQVNIIFHVAASVRFHEPLTTALNINLRATQDLIELAKEVKDLEVKIDFFLLHVKLALILINFDSIVVL